MPKTYSEIKSGLGDMGNLRRLVYFVAVVDTGSFTAAADRLGITKAVVSQQVARLEQEFQTTLLVRTTRKVQTTEAGQSFYHRCSLILRDAESAFDTLSDGVTEPSGTLRLTAPFDYAMSTLVPTIAAYTERYPKCKVEGIFSDQKLDIIASNIELAIRVGWFTEDGLQGRKIGTFRQVLVASASMQAQLEKLKTAADLAALPFIANSALREPLTWQLTHVNTSQQMEVSMQSSIAFDATLAVLETVKQGAGISVLPDYAVADAISTGTLIEVLPEWQLPSGGIYAIFPQARFRPAKVRAFVDLLVSNNPSS